MEEFKVLEIKKIIKALLKKSKMSYADLADQLACSEPTIKRILGEEEMTLSRLLKICEILKVSLTDLESMSTQEKPERIEYPEKQQMFLVKHKGHFAFLMEIYNGLTPAQIATKYKLSAASLQKYLIALEKYDLIKVSAKNKVTPFYPTSPHLGRGPLGTAHFRSIIQNSSSFFIDHIADGLAKNRTSKAASDESTGSRYSVMSVNVTEESYRLYVKEIEAKVRELEKIGNYEEKSNDPKKLKTAVIVLATTTVEQDDKGLDVLMKSFGEVVNL